MSTTFCSSFRLFSVSFSRSLCLSLSPTPPTRALYPFRRFRHSFVRLQLYLFFGRALHFIRHSPERTFTLSLTRTRHRCHVDVAMQRGVQESSTQMRAGNGRLINACIDGIRTYTHALAHWQRHTLIHPHADTHA